MIDRANIKRIERRIKRLVAEGKIATAKDAPERRGKLNRRDNNGEA